MRRVFVVLVLLLLTIRTSKASLIDISVSEYLDGKITAIFYESSSENKPFIIKTEFYNSGSLGYAARLRIDIHNGSDLIYTGWGKENLFPPGSRNTFEIYFFEPQVQGHFIIKPSVYFANEIREFEEIEFELKNNITSQNNIKILDFKTYDDEIEVALRSKKDLNNVLVIPSGYPVTWIFEQGKVEKLEKNRIKRIQIPFTTSFWQKTEIQLFVVDKDGTDFMSDYFELKKETGLRRFLHYSKKWMHNFMKNL